MTELSQDPVLLENYLANKDIYATLASQAYKLAYDQCTKDTKDGKVRRNHGKVLQLALSYGMQANSLALSLEISLDSAKELFSSFRDNLRVAFEYGERVKRECKRNGYVKTMWGRKRRFPDYSLPSFEIVGDMSKDRKKLLVQRLSKTNYMTRQGTIESIENEYNVHVIDNTFKIRQCETQILNSIVQGSAADMTKVALVLIHRDEYLRSIDARPVLVIHDEIILEAPEQYAIEAMQRLEQLMIQAAEQRIKSVPFKAEGEVMTEWHKD